MGQHPLQAGLEVEWSVGNAALGHWDVKPGRGSCLLDGHGQILLDGRYRCRGFVA
jgi:hypothetical protein